MRICIADYVGHPFQVQLSRELARRGHDLLHLHFGQAETPKGRLSLAANDPSTLTISAISLNRPFKKHSYWQRWWQERALGHLFAEKILGFRPHIVVTANMPLDILDRVLTSAKSQGAAFVFWQQDIYSVALKSILQKKYFLLGRLIGAFYHRIEARALAKSDGIIVISPQFRGAIKSIFGVASHKVDVIENWAPLDEISPRPKSNAWSLAHGLTEKNVVLYSGTLGLKHDPGLLLQLAEQLRSRPDARLVVVSEGPRVAWLQLAAREKGLANIVVFPFQPFDVFADVLGSADVVVAMLEQDAGIFSVPSKILSYLAAGKPIVLSAPLENLASQTLEKSKAGFCHAPEDRQAWLASVELLLDDGRKRDEFGSNARTYAEQQFDIATIADRFLEAFKKSIALKVHD